MRKPTPSWKIIGSFFTKRYTFCFKHKLHLKSDQKTKNRNPFLFILTSVKGLRHEKRWSRFKKYSVSWTRFQEKSSKVMKPAFWNARTPTIFRLLQRKDFAWCLWFPSRNASHLDRDLPCHVQLPWLRTREFDCEIAFRPDWGIRIVRWTLVGRIPYTPFSRNATFFALKVCSVCNMAGNVKKHEILTPATAEERKNACIFHPFWQGNSPAK